MSGEVGARGFCALWTVEVRPHCTMLLGHAECVALLLEAGCWGQVLTKMHPILIGKTASRLAAECGHLEVAWQAVGRGSREAVGH